ncbi:protein kinase, putative, partial [Entamoeba invadens IP1]
VYSFGVTMYEIFGWCEAYPVKQFKFPWKIVEYVISGERLLV